MKSFWKAAAQKGFVTWVLLILIWYIASLFNKPEFLPSPWATLLGGKELLQNGILPFYIGISFRRILIGWALGILIGIPIGLVVGQFKPVHWIVEPFINFFRFVPAIGFLTLFLMWFGVGETSKIVLILYATIFPVIINTISGVISIDPIKLQAARSQGASSFQVFYSVVVPASVPYIFTGVRLGFGGAIISIVAAEMLAAQEGIGYLIYTSRLYYRTDWIFVGIVTLGLMGFLADKLLRLFGRTVMKKYGIKDGT